MCGIVAVSLNKSSKKNVSEITKYLVSKIIHRGPDRQGIKSIGSSAVGMSRLCIRTTPNEKTPYPYSGKYIAFNGEIYSQKIGNDIIKTTSSQDEICAILSQDEIDGMYSYAILDQEGVIQLARDPFGIKPLYIKILDDGIAASSEIRGLLDVGKNTLNPEAIKEFLVYGGLFSHDSFYKEIKSLKPGYSATLINGCITYQKCKNRLIKYKSKNKSISKLSDAIKKSIENCLSSNYPIGVTLSGGIDSTLIMNIMSEYIEPITDVPAFSIKLNDYDGLSETSMIYRNTSQKPNLNLNSRSYDGSTFFDNTRQSVEMLCTPHAMTSCALYVELAKLISKTGIRVILSGEGADELFCGYQSYLKVQKKNCSLYDFYISGNEVFEKYVNKIQPPNYLKQISASTKKHLTEHEYKFSLEPLLTRMDHILMSQGIEGRVPFLHGEIEHISSLYNMSECLNGNITKTPLIASFKMLLGNEIPVKEKIPFRFELQHIHDELVVHCFNVLHDHKLLFESSGISVVKIISLIDNDSLSEAEVNFLFRLITIGFWFEFLNEKDIDYALG